MILHLYMMMLRKKRVRKGRMEVVLTQVQVVYQRI